MKVAETGFARRKDLDFFGCEWLIKFKRAERFVFLRAQLCSNRSKFSAEREGEGTLPLSALIFNVFGSVGSAKFSSPNLDLINLDSWFMI